MAGTGGFASQTRTFWAGLSTGKRVALGLVALGGIAGAAVLANLSGRVEYGALWTNLSEEDTAAIAQKLKEKKIPFQVEGRTLMVPKEQVGAIRLELTAEQLPRGGGAGFELFDKTRLGVSEFTQQLNYRRALEGELARTIRGMHGVDSVRVHLVLPKRSLFVERGEVASASVVLKLRGGTSLGGAGVKSIVHLVSSAVEGLRPDNMTVVDGDGRLLWKGQSGGDEAGGSGGRNERDRALERSAVAMLEKAVGVGKALVTVTTEVETQSQEKLTEAYDPDSRVARSEQETRDAVATGAAAVAGGVPGARANLPVTPNATPTAPPSQGSSRQSSLRNYELTKTTTKVREPGGKIRKLSVAVLVDGRYEEKDGKKAFVARGVEELKTFEEIVRSAVGYQQDRGDIVTVRSLPFELPAAAGTEVAAEAPGEAVWVPYAKWGGVGLAVLFFFLFVVRPVMRSIAPPTVLVSGKDEPKVGGDGTAPGDATAAAPSGVAGALGAGKGEQVEIPAAALTPRELAIRAVQADPRRAAQIVRTWLAEKSAKDKDKEKEKAA